MEFFWYDFETLGRNPRIARAAQFFGIRTDAELNEISRTETLYCRPSLDWLPVPSSCAVHALKTTDLSTLGLKEADFARRIHAELSQPGTCAVGYNATRFDHEVTRFLFWRTLRDPYAWHWQHGNAKWDLIDLMRAAYVLRPQGLMWPTNEKGKPTFRLHALANANDVEHVPSHTADADVLTLIELAKLVRSAQPKLFDYYLALRSAKEVKRRIEDVFLWISGKIAPSRGCVTLMAPLAPDPDYAKRLIAFDLAVDPLELAGMSPNELETRLFGRDQGIRPVHGINMNGIPFVVERDYLTGRTTGALEERAGLDAARMWERERELRQDHALCRRLIDAWTAHQESRREEATDVDEALYDAFVPDWIAGSWRICMSATLPLPIRPGTRFRTPGCRSSFSGTGPGTIPRAFRRRKGSAGSRTAAGGTFRRTRTGRARSTAISTRSGKEEGMTRKRASSGTTSRATGAL